MWRTSSARRKSLPPIICWPGPRLIRLRPLAGLGGAAMELFTQLFGDVLAFVYHCFDRIVIYGYLSALSRPEQVVHFFRNVVGVAVVSKDVLSQRTADYQAWVEAYARNHRLPLEWAERECARKIMSCPGNAAWRSGAPTASISSSRAWSRARPFASPCRNTSPKIPITGSWRTSAAASHIIIFTSAMRSSVQS